MIEYVSTHGMSRNVSFKEAVLNGLAPDGGLYMPQRLNKWDKKIFSSPSFSDLCFEAAKTFIEGEIEDDALKEICDSAFNFKVPLIHLEDNLYILELFHGPTAAFKDFGARFMARILGKITAEWNKRITILVATSGDTGSAVANGFYQVPNINVVILYPKGKVSFLQEKQLTTLGHNITAIEINGTFDDCQRLVKEAFIDNELREQLTLTSANSINIGRLYPQSFYYLWAYQELTRAHKNKSAVIFATPSGNFGNLTAGVMAQFMGLAVKLFIAATNSNDIIPQYLKSGFFTPRTSLLTYSNAMDVGNPSNFERILHLYKTHEAMTQGIKGYKVTDNETIEAIAEVYNRYHYLLDPHTAVGYKAVKNFLKEQKFFKNTPIVILSTAHAAKFGGIIKDKLGIDVVIPDLLMESLKKEKMAISMANDFFSFKQFLLN